MAAFLTGDGVLCHHELMKYCPTKGEFYRGMFHPHYKVGNSDSGLPLTDFQSVFSGCATVIIERPIDDVHRSLHDIEIPVGMDWLEDMRARLSGLDGMRVQFEDIDRQLVDVCDYIGVPYSREKHDIFRRLIVLTNDFTPDNYGIWR